MIHKLSLAIHNDWSIGALAIGFPCTVIAFIQDPANHVNHGLMALGAITTVLAFFNQSQTMYKNNKKIIVKVFIQKVKVFFINLRKKE